MNEIKIEVKSIDKGTICVIPLGDLHIGSEYFSESKLREVVDEVMSHTNYYVILGGDYIQNSTKTIKFNDVYNEPSIDSQIALAEQILKPLAIPDKDHPNGRILAMLEGNHEERSQIVGLSPAMILCGALSKLGRDKDGKNGNGLEKRYSNTECVIFVRTHRRGNEGNFVCYTINCTHGKGNGTTLGSALNQLNKMSIRLSGCMCYIMFHHHKPIVAKQDHLNISDNEAKVKRQTQLLVMGNAFTTNADYSEKASLVPTSLAVPHIWFRCIDANKMFGKKEKASSYKTCDCIL